MARRLQPPPSMPTHLRALHLDPKVSPQVARAHALKNYLSVVCAVSHLIEGEVSDRGRERLARLRAAASQMTTLIDEELRTDPRDDDDEILDVGVAEIVRDVVQKTEDCAERARVQLVVTCGSGFVRGDVHLLAEALRNVVSNAIAATPPNGVVRVTTLETAGGDQEWIVQDTGCGMPSEIVARIGRPGFFARAGGSGFGVAIVCDALRRHGGGLSFRSAPGAGTTVTMWLPRARHPVGR